MIYPTSITIFVVGVLPFSAVGDFSCDLVWEGRKLASSVNLWGILNLESEDNYCVLHIERDCQNSLPWNFVTSK